MKSILMDEREIKRVNYNDAEESFHEVGVLGCSKIEAYGEKGMYNDIAWIAVYYDGELTNRIPASQVEIIY